MEMLFCDAVLASAREEQLGPIWTRSKGDAGMHFGLLTAPFEDTPLMEVATLGRSANGFSALEIACWPVQPAVKNGAMQVRATSMWMG